MDSNQDKDNSDISHQVSNKLLVNKDHPDNWEMEVLMEVAEAPKEASLLNMEENDYFLFKLLLIIPI